MSKVLIDRPVVEQALKALETDDWQKKMQSAISLRAALEQPQGEQEPIRWPANASEVRAFLSGHVATERYARDDHQPDDNDTYTLSAHDLLGAIYWWADVYQQPPRQPLTDEQIDAMFANAEIGDALAERVRKRNQEIYWFGVRDAEAAHGIGA